MRTPFSRLTALKKPLLALALLAAALAALLYLPVLVRPARPAAVAHTIPLIVRHAPEPVVRHVRAGPRPENPGR